MAGLEGGADQMNEQLMQSMLSSRPHLLPACRVTPAIIRNEHWVILKNPVSGDLVRLHRDLWSAVTQFDGKTRVEHWMDEYSAKFGEQRLLAALLTLQRAGIVQTGVQLNQPETGFGHQLMRYNPLMIRLALFNPTDFSTGCVPLQPRCQGAHWCRYLCCCWWWRCTAW